MLKICNLFRMCYFVMGLLYNKIDFYEHAFWTENVKNDLLNYLTSEDTGTYNKYV